MGLVAVVGATGTGKSAFALALARRLNDDGREAVIVNADAMQFYRGMDIGTAKVTAEERGTVRHEMLDVLDVTDEASVAWYQQEARAIIQGLLDANAVPILVGGSGLYVSSVIYDLQFPGTDREIRSKWEARLASEGVSALHRELEQLDAETAAQVDPFNGRRIVRALEVIELTGSPAAARLPEYPESWRPADIVMLETPRAQLVERLERRVDEMWAAGLLGEVRELIPQGLERGVTASRAIGYAQALGEIRGDLTRDEAIAQTQQLTRVYARRQVGWFRRYRGAHTLDAANAEQLDAQVERVARLE